MRWIRSDGADLPTHLSPCRKPLASDKDRVAGRQLVIEPTEKALRAGRPRLWKSERLSVYRDAPAAIRAMRELRGALAECARHDEGGGVTAVWRSEPLDIGDEALFVGGQLFHGTVALPGHYRGVVMRQGRGVMTYLDFGPLTTPAEIGETAEQQEDARTMATRLAREGCLRS